MTTTLLTDLYQLTMAQGYVQAGIAERRAAFHLFFRKLPFQGGYAVAAGLEDALKWLEAFHFDDSDCDYLQTLRGADDKPLFSAEFLRFIRGKRLSLDVHAISEGSVVFGQEPLLRVEGPLWEAQIVETALLNILNFQTLIATKSARVCQAALGEPVLEFGLRRAQGIDGALSASRAAFIGGAAATSNVLAGKRYGIPVRGTHAHAWVMAFADEREAFASYARSMPNNCVFLVDTYDTLQGVKHAIEVGQWLRSQGHRLLGVRLDSGDLAYLSIEARKLLDAAGFADASIVASNDLDEHLIEDLKRQGATINVWGVGTKLVTAYDQPALGGVYKLAAIQDEGGHWQHKVKISEQAIKTSTPGRLNVRRYRDAERFVADAIFAVDTTPSDTIVDPVDPLRRKQIEPGLAFEDLLQPVMRGGVCEPAPALTAVRQHAQTQLGLLHAGTRRFKNPHPYPAGLDLPLHEARQVLVQKAKGIV